MSIGVTTKHERAVIEQSRTVTLSSEQILTVIEQLHACYDYCAAWKESPQEADLTAEEERRADLDNQFHDEVQAHE